MSGTDSKTVEEVIDRRIRNRQIEYCIKWKGLSSEYNTWENERNLDVPHLILQFEENNSNAGFEYHSGEHDQSSDDSFDLLVKRHNQRKERKTAIEHSTAGSHNEDGEEEKKPFGFDRGLQPKQILDAIVVNGERMFLMDWKDSDDVDLIPVELANVKWPNLVIKFYENRFPWHKSEPTE